jgi:anaerobic magnesium-protoporphyrin IX monomethyl ester cyclase
MRYALINPNWTFDGSIYFGCREPHLPLEYGYARALLHAEGHEAVIIDGQLENLSNDQIRARVADFAPDFTVITTAPSYLFWRCAPPELRVPQQMVRLLRDASRQIVIVGPHGSTTPKATLRKTGADVLIMGECEDILPKLAKQHTGSSWRDVQSIAYWNDRAAGDVRVQGFPNATDMAALPALSWDRGIIARHSHHHHRFDAAPTAPGAEMETSRGCPYHCSFCAKDNFRNKYRKRPLNVILEELDGLIEAGIEYVYFVDEIFLPNKELLEALVPRAEKHNLKFGVQTRIDLFTPDMLDLMGRAGCVSIEAGVESISPEGRAALDKNCKLSTDEITERLIHAKQHSGVAFVQANLIEARVDDADAVRAWREHLLAHGVWANEPVPLFPYPGSPDYGKLWGVPDDAAWERAHEHYLNLFNRFSDVQNGADAIIPLSELEVR